MADDLPPDLAVMIRRLDMDTPPAEFAREDLFLELAETATALGAATVLESGGTATVKDADTEAVAACRERAEERFNALTRELRERPSMDQLVAEVRRKTEAIREENRTIRDLYESILERLDEGRGSSDYRIK